MANEYKLSYTAEEINNKLGEIDQLSKEIANQQTQLDSKQPKGNYLTAVPSEYVTEAELATELAKMGSQTPLFADSIEECTDTTKMYVLPDGFIYAYMFSEVVVAGSKNHADMNADGWSANSRLGSSGADSSNTGTDITNYIPVTAGGIIRFKNTAPHVSHRVAFYDSNKNYLGIMALSTMNNGGCITTDSNGITTWVNVCGTTPTGSATASVANTAYVRITVNTPTDTPIITVNEEIKESSTTTTWAWTNTGHAFVPADYENEISALQRKQTQHETKIANLQTDVTNLDERLEIVESGEDGDIPTYWKAHLDSKIATVKSLQDQYGKDCFSYIIITDIHWESNLGKLSVLLAKKVAESCGIKYILILGDIQTRHGANHELAYIENEWVEIEAFLSPIRDRLLITQGNHDGSYDIIDINNDGVADDITGDGTVNSADKNVYNLTPQQLYNRIFRKVSNIDNVHFSSDGTGYYVDDTGRKVRYIMLNTHVNKYETNANGSMKYNNMQNFRFGQAQYDMVIEALETIPSDDWYVVPCSHVPLDRTGEYIYFGGEVDGNGALLDTSVADCTVMQKLLNAYKTKSSYSGSFTGTQGGFDAVSVNVDFANAKGNLVAFHGGHCHKDVAYPPTYNWNGAEKSEFYIVTTRCDGRCENDSALMEERVAGTTTEQSFDVFTLVKGGNLYRTKIGAGDDETIAVV